MGGSQTVPSTKEASSRDWVSLVPQAQDRESGTASFDFVCVLRAENISQGPTVSLVQGRICSYSKCVDIVPDANGKHGMEL